MVQRFGWFLTAAAFVVAAIRVWCPNFIPEEQQLVTIGSVTFNWLRLIFNVSPVIGLIPPIFVAEWNLLTFLERRRRRRARHWERTRPRGRLRRRREKRIHAERVASALVQATIRRHRQQQAQRKRAGDSSKLPQKPSEPTEAEIQERIRREEAEIWALEAARRAHEEDQKEAARRRHKEEAATRVVADLLARQARAAAARDAAEAAARADSAWVEDLILRYEHCPHYADRAFLEADARAHWEERITERQRIRSDAMKLHRDRQRVAKLQAQAPHIYERACWEVRELEIAERYEVEVALRTKNAPPVDPELRRELKRLDAKAAEEGALLMHTLERKAELKRKAYAFVDTQELDPDHKDELRGLIDATVSRLGNAATPATGGGGNGSTTY